MWLAKQETGGIGESCFFRASKILCLLSQGLGGSGIILRVLCSAELQAWSHCSVSDTVPPWCPCMFKLRKHRHSSTPGEPHFRVAQFTNVISLPTFPTPLFLKRSKAFLLKKSIHTDLRCCSIVRMLQPCLAECKKKKKKESCVHSGCQLL